MWQTTLTRFVQGWPVWRIHGCSLALIVTFSFLDHATGYETSFAVFYLIPIMFASWYAQGRAGYVFCLISAVAWLAVDFTSGHEYSQAWIPYWNALTRLCIFLLVAYLLLSLKATLRHKEQLIERDALTGVKSLRAFLHDASAALKAAARYRYPVSLGFIDLDGFKGLNDSLGHAVGDEALKVTGEKLNLLVRGSDLTARVGGDEFVVLLSHSRADGTETFFIRLHQQLVNAMKERGWNVGFTIGVAVLADGTKDLKLAVERADTLMLEAKRRGKNTVSIREFLPQDNAAEKLAV